MGDGIRRCIADLGEKPSSIVNMGGVLFWSSFSALSAVVEGVRERMRT